MSFTWPTDRCTFCGGAYYVQKLAVHESICSMRPRRLTVSKAVRIVVELHPEALKDRAFLVRLVWQIRDGYFTEPPRGRLTDPKLILARARQVCPTSAGSAGGRRRDSSFTRGSSVIGGRLGPARTGHVCKA